MVYTVIFSANKPASYLPGYEHGFEAINSNGISCATWNNPGKYKILKKKVKSESGTSAIIKFITWQNNGKPESWLLN